MNDAATPDKETSAATEAASTDTNTANNPAPKNTKVCIVGSYERRCLERLLKSDCERPHLDKVVGTTNSPEFIRSLRRRGLTILTSRVKGLNRDGRRVWWGKYHLISESIPMAKKLLGVEQ